MPERPRRAAYYRAPASAPAGAAILSAPAAAEPRQPRPLYGAAAIADYLKLREKQVYRLVECHRGRIPIRKLVGIGLTSDEEVLAEWWDRVIIRGEAP